MQQFLRALSAAAALALLAATVVVTAESVSAYPGSLLDALRVSPHFLLHETYRDGNWEIALRRSDGSQGRNLTRTKDVHELYPKAAPDGSKICFVADETRDGKRVRSVYVMDRDGRNRKLVASNARQPCWSPDSKTIAYLAGEFSKYTVTDFATKGVFFHDVAKGTTTKHPNEKIHHLYNICWAPNGKWIVATVHGGMGYGHAMLALEIDGDGVHDLGIGGCRPDLSPDGTRITWGRDDHTIAVAEISLEVGVPKVTNQRAVVKDEQHVYHSEWSPDGRFIVFSRGPGGRVKADGPGTSRGLAEFVGVRAKWDLWVVRANGGAPVRLTDDGAANKEADWLPALADSRTSAGK